MGGGVTGVAVITLGCRFVGIDPDPDCEIAFNLLMDKVRKKAGSWGWNEVLESEDLEVPDEVRHIIHNDTIFTFSLFSLFHHYPTPLS